MPRPQTRTVIYHPGTGVYMLLSECISVNVPVDTDDIESYLFEYGGNELTQIGGKHD